jgi:hypothetical protein
VAHQLTSFARARSHTSRSRMRLLPTPAHQAAPTRRALPLPLPQVVGLLIRVARSHCRAARQSIVESTEGADTSTAPKFTRRRLGVRTSVVVIDFVFVKIGYAVVKIGYAGLKISESKNFYIAVLFQKTFSKNSGGRKTRRYLIENQIPYYVLVCIKHRRILYF